MTTKIESSIIRALTAELKTVCQNVFFGKSQVIYPKINADLQLFEETSYNCRYRLTLDYYADDSSPMTVITMSEDVRAAFFAGMLYDENGALIALHKTGGGGFAEEKDNEKIVHYENAYEVAYYKSQEI